MKILWVGVSVAATTGYGKQTRDIVQRLIDKHEIIICGHTSDVIVWGGKQHYELPNNKKVLSLPMSNPLINQASAVDSIKMYIAKYKPDIIFGFWDGWALSFLEDLNYPYAVMIPIDGTFTEKWANYIKNANWIITYSRFGYNELLNYLPPSKCYYIPHGIDCSIFRPLRTKKEELRSEIQANPPIPNDCFLFSYVAANIGDRKKIPLLMRTFKRFTEEHPNAHLYLHTNANAQLGRGYDLALLRAMQGLEKNIHFPSFNPILESVSETELTRIYNATDVYIHNSVAEGYGLPILEATACGVPAIAGRNSSCVELVEGHGWIAENVNEDGYVDFPVYVPQLTSYPVIDQRSMLAKMEEAYTDEKLRKEYGKKARRFALGYSWKRIMAKWASFFDVVESDLKLFRGLQR